MFYFNFKHTLIDASKNYQCSGALQSAIHLISLDIFYAILVLFKKLQKLYQCTPMKSSLVSNKNLYFLNKCLNLI